jgi:hypothetical protein
MVRIIFTNKASPTSWGRRKNPDYPLESPDLEFGPFEAVRYRYHFKLPNKVPARGLVGVRPDGSEQVLALVSGDFGWSVYALAGSPSRADFLIAAV